MRVIVTGATGFVGGRIARALRARGDEVLAVVRTPTDDLADLGVEQRVVAIDDRDAVAAAMDGAAAVVHAAASADPDLVTARAVNTLGTRALVGAALTAGVARFVHVSTTSVYDRAASGDGELSEDSPLVTQDAGPAPTSSAGSAYAITKAEAEAEVARGEAAGLSVAILRPPAVLGAGPTSTWGKRMPARYRDGELGPIPPDTTFAWVHVDDFADATLAALDRDVQTTLNVVGGHTTFGAYLAALRAFLPEAPAAVAAVAAGTEPPWRGRYATDRLAAVLGVAPSRDFDTAMAEIAADWDD